MYYKDSKLDWEIRQFWAPDVYAYALCKDKSEEAEQAGDTEEEARLETKRKDIVKDAMRRLFERFPDCRPSHPLRNIEESSGKKALGRYYAKYRDKFTSDAGRMKRLYQKTQGKADMLATKNSTMTLLEVLGRARGRIAHQLWGRSKAGGLEECDAEIERELEEWFEANPKMTKQDGNRHRITIVHSVRHRLFNKLPPPVKEIWKKRAKSIHIPTTPEEEQCLADAALAYLDELLVLLAERANMHFFLLAAARGSSNIPVIFREFTRNPVEDERFLKPSEGLGARLRTDYLAYCLKRFRGDIDEVVFALPEVLDDQNEDENSVNDKDNETSNRVVKGKAKKADPPRKTYIPPFQPDPLKTQSVVAKAKAIGEFILMAIEKLHCSRVSWDKVTKHASIYIDPQRMPMDPDFQGQRLQFQKPAAMTDTRIKVFFEFLVNSYNGTLPEEECFRFKHEARHLNLPAPVPPSDPNVHHAAAAAAKTAVPKRKKDGTQGTKHGTRPKKLKKSEGDTDDVYHDIDGLMLELDASYLDEAQELTNGAKTRRTATNGAKTQHTAPRKGKSTRFVSPTPPPEEPEAEVPTPLPPAIKNVAIPLAPPSSAEGPLAPSQSSNSQTKFTPESDTDELSHPLFRPGYEDTFGEWASTKTYLERWAENMTFSEHQARTMPFTGLSGNKPDVELPSGLHSVLCILQLWIAYQEEPLGEHVPCVSLSPRLALATLHPTHRVSIIISVLLDTNGPLPSAKYVYTQAHFTIEEVCALFAQIEVVVSQFIDAMVASEEVILSSNLGLLQAMRVAIFMGASGFILDGGVVGVNTQRTSAIVDRFISVTAAIALIRYFKVVLGRVADLYTEGSEGSDTSVMWKLLTSFWSSACSTLARAVAHSTSDLFSLGSIWKNMPREFNTPLELAFAARSWWTPGGSGAPGPVSMPNRQMFATEKLLTYVKELDWSEYSLIERSQVMLLLFTAAIQTEKGQVSVRQLPRRTHSTIDLMSEALKSLTISINQSTEVRPRANPINIPTDDIQRSVNRWEDECQQDSEAFNESLPPMNEDATLQSGDDSEPLQPAVSSAIDLRQSAASHLVIANPGVSESRSIVPSQATDDSIIPPEEEDQIFPSSVHDPVSPPAALGDRACLPIAKGPSSTRKVVPAIRPLEDASGPPPKKRKGREVDPCPLDDVSVRTLRSSKDTKATETPKPPEIDQTPPPVP
ncbi:hypothetical protein M407DRAFT_26937 [Tulasnella calospora MUT 4182]|uniref:Uncharacterized protein n=1 Tax=Tulasnella calospora MUT 4182 TaxID=1051891 RepID=A0A0C3Q401_9AGAM|nr:hypothetical protein M407DRAFT_26937 [Tulasnella calospora MUT 4182]